MSLQAESRQAKRNRKLIEAGMHRLDTHLDDAHWQMFLSLRDTTNSTQRDTLEFALDLMFLMKVLEGKIAPRRLSEICAALAAKMKASGAAANDDGETDDVPGA